MPVLPSYRNQSIDLHSKSIDWFLYKGNTSIYWVNQISLSNIVKLNQIKGAAMGAIFAPTYATLSIRIFEKLIYEKLTDKWRFTRNLPVHTTFKIAYPKYKHWK